MIKVLHAVGATIFLRKITGNNFNANYNNTLHQYPFLPKTKAGIFFNH
jgi:hypothetical protein